VGKLFAAIQAESFVSHAYLDAKLFWPLDFLPLASDLNEDLTVIAQSPEVGKFYIVKAFPPFNCDLDHFHLLGSFTSSARGA
jgi:hypothetical protein